MWTPDVTWRTLHRIYISPQANTNGVIFLEDILIPLDLGGMAVTRSSTAGTSFTPTNMTGGQIELWICTQETGPTYRLEWVTTVQSP
jgi:hypothetical protein